MQACNFICARWGLEAIKNRRLKISTLDSLNDPFEVLPFDLSNVEHRIALEGTKDGMNQKTGLLCFCKHWHNPLMWAHYADRHRGICLGFEIAEDRQGEVRYISRPLLFAGASLETEKRSKNTA
jgi:hypothetical protein